MSTMSSAAFLTPDEFACGIRDLSDADWVRLRKVAALRARNPVIEAEDLLQEAFHRALDGRRNCPVNVDLVRFLAEAMRSIADAELEKAGVRHRDNEEEEARTRDAPPRLVPIANHGGDETAVDPPDTRLDPEQRASSGEEAAAMRACMIPLFQDDEVAQVILEGMMEGIDGEELRELTDLDKTAYQSKRRLIRRRIEKRFPKGWMS